jgi:hypothetical protein
MSVLKQNPALADALQELSDEYGITTLTEAILELRRELGCIRPLPVAEQNV